MGHLNANALRSFATSGVATPPRPAMPIKQQEVVVLIGNQFTRESMVNDLTERHVIVVEVAGGTAHALCSSKLAEEKLAAAPESSRSFVWLQTEAESREMEHDHWVPDDDANKLLYGKHVRAADILAGKQQPPEGFNVLIDDLMLIENSGLDTSTLLRPVGSGLMRSLPVSHSVRSVHSSRSDE